jgi:hypothetical protein
MSAVAALAVASPFAVIAVSELAAGSKPPAPQQHEFVQAAAITDLPSEVISALQQGLSQFGIVVPNMPSSITGGSSTPASSALTAPGGLGLTAPGGLTTPGLTAPTPGLTPGLTPAATPGLTAPGATTPALTDPSLTNTGLTNTGLTNTGLTNTGLTNTGLTNTGLTNPGLASPAPASPGPTNMTAPGLTPGVLTPATDGPNPALVSPTGLTPGLGAPSEVPISAPIGGDAGLGQTYPILGGADPSLAAPSSGGGGLMNDLSQAANQLGLSQGIDLLKGVLMPSIMQAMKAGAPAPAPAPAPPLPPG